MLPKPAIAEANFRHCGTCGEVALPFKLASQATVSKTHDLSLLVVMLTEGLPDVVPAELVAPIGLV